MNDELKLQLSRQLQFLTNSLRLYDEGHKEESLRIAVAIRVLLHDTNMSTSVLQHAGVKASTHLLSTAGGIDPAATKGADYVMHFPTTFGAAGVHPTSPTELAIERKKMVLAPQWWEEPVLFHKQKTFTRRQIVLVAANKDGGAHTEDVAHADVDILREGFWQEIFKKTDGTQEVRPVANNHFPLLRHFAEELLLSPELVKLAV